jgi:hypothetical protein
MTEQIKTKNENQLVIFNQLFLKSNNYRYARRKVALALKQVRDWLNRSLKQQEQLPVEFENIGIYNQQNYLYQKERELWNTQFHI